MSLRILWSHAKHQLKHTSKHISSSMLDSPVLSISIDIIKSRSKLIAQTEMYSSRVSSSLKLRYPIQLANLIESPSLHQTEDISTWECENRSECGRKIQSSVTHPSMHRPSPISRQLRAGCILTITKLQPSGISVLKPLASSSSSICWTSCAENPAALGRRRFRREKRLERGKANAKKQR